MGTYGGIHKKLVKHCEVGISTFPKRRWFLSPVKQKNLSLLQIVFHFANSEHDRYVFITLDIPFRISPSCFTPKQVVEQIRQTPQRKSPEDITKTKQCSKRPNFHCNGNSLTKKNARKHRHFFILQRDRKNKHR